MSTVELLNQLFKNLEGSIRPTEIYNEGWMLKCVMEQIVVEKIKHDDLKFPANVKWYSEASLLSFFKAINRGGDRLAEGQTKADSIVGDFKIRQDTKSGVEIEQNCSCLYIIEAKMFSPLSKKVDNADDFNQCARNIACLMKMIYDGIEEKKISEIPVEVGFYVFLPEEQENYFKWIREKENITKPIKDRLNSYFKNEIINEVYKEKKEKELNWAKDNLDAFMEKLDVKLIFWEDLIKGNSEMNTFYENCKNYNGKIKK